MQIIDLDNRQHAMDLAQIHVQNILLDIQVESVKKYFIYFLKLEEKEKTVVISS